MNRADSGKRAVTLPSPRLSRFVLWLAAFVVATITGQLFTASSVHANHTPSPPILIETFPPSPADYNSPVIAGDSELDTNVELFDNPSCTGPPRGTGSSAEFLNGILVPVPDDSTTTFYATATHPPGSPSGCSSTSITYVEASTPPPAPIITGTEPPSPANNNYPLIKGTARPSSVIELFDNPSCTGIAVASGGVEASGQFGVLLYVPDNSARTVWAKATLSSFESGCSSSSITYVEITPPPPPPPGPTPAPPCPPPEVPPGATYRGTHSQGGTVCFTVTANWSHVTSFLVVGDACNNWLQGIFSAPIAANRGFKTRSLTTRISGSFDAGQGATGAYRDHEEGVCDTGDLTWSASTTATPPWAIPPVVADKNAPGLRLRAQSSQRAVRQKGIVVEVQCPTEACTATAQGTVSVPGAARTYTLKAVTKQIAKGGRAKLKLRLSKGPLKAIKRALRRHRRPEARITVTVKDASANATVQKRRIRLKR